MQYPWAKRMVRVSSSQNSQTNSSGMVTEFTPEESVPVFSSEEFQSNCSRSCGRIELTQKTLCFKQFLVCHNSSSLKGNSKSLVVQLQREQDLQRSVAAHLEGNDEYPQPLSDRQKQLHIPFSTLCAIALQHASFAIPDLQGEASQANP